MHFSRLHGWCCCAGLSSLLAASAFGQTIELDNAAGPGKITVRQVPPVEYFRGLLALKPEEQELALKQYPPVQRKALAEKLQEYQILPPEIRELRLHYTQVRWELVTLMKMEPNERAELLSEVSAADRPLVLQRLRLWDGWSADVKKQFLENEGAINILLQGSSAAVTNKATYEGHEKELQRWQLLTGQQRQEMCDRFGQFFELTEKEQAKTLSALPQAERKQMEGAIQKLEDLPAEQRRQRLEALQKFSAMKPEVQRRFLLNAARWKAMSAKDRAAWRQVADKLPPIPPMPPGLEKNLPPMPPGLPPLPPLPPTD